MFPILYDQITAGIVPQHNGLGVLSDCVSCYVEQSRNSKYELTMVYKASGIHASEIAERRVLKVKPNFTDDPQLFRIDRIGKTMNGTFTVYAKHISYDLSSYEITSGTASSAVAACTLLQSAASGYTFTTDKIVSKTFKINTPASVRSYFAGRSGSFVDVFGTTEIKYDNFNVEFLLHAGANRDVTIRYGKNLLELSQEIDSSNLYTHVICFYKDGDNDAIVGNKVATGLTLDVPKTLVLDVTSSFDSEPTVSDLTDKATAYKDENNLTVPNNNIKLDFAQSGELTGRVDLCDTVTVFYEALGITRAEVKCIRTKWDCIHEKYVETEFGDAKGGITETISVMQKEVAEKPSTTRMEAAINNATQAITGNLGGYVVLHDTNNDGSPDEILIMDTPDINTAVKVWRWNQGGLAYSDTGYSGTYSTAIYDGHIVADFVDVGILNANLIKAGVISDLLGNSQIDMTNGEATLYELKAKGYCRAIDADTLDTLAEVRTGALGGVVDIFNRNNIVVAWMDCDSDANGRLIVRNASGGTKFYFFVGGNDDGVLDIYDSNGDVGVTLSGGTGGNGHIEQSGGAVSLWTGTLHSGNFHVPLGKYTSFLFKWRVSNTGNYMTMAIPRADITNTQQGFQFNTEAQYYSFGVYSDTIDDVESLVVQFVSRTSASTGHIVAVYGIY